MIDISLIIAFIENIDSALGQFFGEVDFLHLKRIDLFDFLQHAIGDIA